MLLAKSANTVKSVIIIHFSFKRHEKMYKSARAHKSHRPAANIPVRAEKRVHAANYTARALHI